MDNLHIHRLFARSENLVFAPGMEDSTSPLMQMRIRLRPPLERGQMYKFRILPGDVDYTRLDEFWHTDWTNYMLIEELYMWDAIPIALRMITGNCFLILIKLFTYFNFFF